jgi:hypothetical protein
MATKWVVAPALLLWALLGCSVTRPGTLQRMPDGPVVEVKVTVEGEAASVEGVDPQTGERLLGRFHDERAPDTSGAPKVILVPDESGPALQSARDTTLRLIGTLEGDQGTRLRCSLEVQRRVLIRGAGSCRPIDSTGETTLYRLKF